MGNLKFRIPGQIKYNSGKQIKALQELEKEGLIQNFKKEISRANSAKMVFTFNLCPYFFEMPDTKMVGDFSKYRIKVEYGGSTAPRVFVSSHKLDKKCPHLYEDGQLCLYKPSLFVWKNHHSIAKDIVPLVYTWLYFYEKWIETGKWLGPEAPH